MKGVSQLLSLQTCDDVNTQQADKTKVKSNFELYKKDYKMSHVDVLLVCLFFAAKCELWMPFDSDNSIYLPAHRYTDLGRCTEME